MFTNTFLSFWGEQASAVAEEDVLKVENTTVSGQNHPYYPTTLKLNYTEQTYSVAFLLTVFFLAVSVVAILSFKIIRRKPVTSLNKGHFVWFIITGCIHLFFEGYISLFHETIAEDNGIMSQLWKEYSLCDSRYLSSDSFVISMERITAAIWGPVSFLTSIAIYKNHPSRHLLQLIVSVGQIYGLVLYYLTSLFENSPHSRPEVLYYWVYFWGINFVWMIIPVSCVIQSWKFLVNLEKESIQRKNKKIK